MYFHRFTRYTILGTTTANSIHCVGAALANSQSNLATELLYKADVMKPSPLHTQCMDMPCWYIQLVMKEHMSSLVPSISNPQIFIACSMKNWDWKDWVRGYHTWHMYFHRFTRYTILGITTANSIHSIGAALTNSLHNLATELLLYPWTSRCNLTATTVGGIIRSDIKVDSVETVIRFRQGPPEGDIMSVIISIALDVFTGYIVKNGSGWWYTWVWEGDSTHFQWEKSYECLQWLHPLNLLLAYALNC